MWAWEGPRDREIQNLKQVPGSELSARSLSWGLNSQTERSWPEPKSDAQPTEPHRRPENIIPLLIDSQLWYWFHAEIIIFLIYWVKYVIKIKVSCFVLVCFPNFKIWLLKGHLGGLGGKASNFGSDQKSHGSWFEPCAGIYAGSLEPASDSLSPFLFLPLLCSCFLSLSKINKH